MNVVFLVGRLLFASLFIRAGIEHFRDDGVMVGYARARGVPDPSRLVPLTGLMCLVGGISIALGLWADLGALLLIAFLIPDALIMHAYWKLPPERQSDEALHFYKDLALLGAAMVIFYLYDLGQDLPASLSSPVLGRF
jgi:putative oxidoreductase